MYKAIRAGILLFLVAFVGPAAAGGQAACPPVAEKPTPERLQAGARNARDHGFLWRIEKDGHASFLYGTMHAGKFDWIFPGPTVTQSLQATDTVALELDILDKDIQERMVKGMAAQHGAAVPEPLVRRLRKQAGLACISWAAIAGYTPEMQITTLTMMVGRRDGLDASYAIDGVLAGFGHGTHRNVVSLESPEAQLKMLQMQSPQETASFVDDGLTELESGRARKALIKIARVWENSDYDALENYSDWCDCLNTDNERAMMKRLLDERNPNLAAGINALHESGKNVFAAVGSLHMAGPTGLPIQMMKLGYSVERVRLK